MNAIVPLIITTANVTVVAPARDCGFCLGCGLRACNHHTPIDSLAFDGVRGVVFFLWLFLKNNLALLTRLHVFMYGLGHVLGCAADAALLPSPTLDLPLLVVFFCS